MKALTLIAAVASAIFLTACGTRAPAPATPASSASPAATASTAQPFTAAAVKSAAVTYFDLYAAGQYAAVYPLLAPAGRRTVTEATWVKVHDACRNSTTQIAYKVSRPTLAGKAAVVNVSLAGVAASIGSEEVTFAYRGGRWLYLPSDLTVYHHHTAAQAIAALRAQDNCS